MIRHLLVFTFFFSSTDVFCQVSLTAVSRIENTLYNILDKNSGQIFSFSKVDKYYDGSEMDVSKCDDIIYLKYKNEYFKRNFEGGLNIRWFGCNELLSDNQTIINNVLARYKTAFIPEGEFKFSATIVVPENSRLYGTGKSSVLKLISKRPFDAISVHRWVSLKSFKLDCSLTDMDVSAAILINAWNTVESIMGEIKFQDLIIMGNYPQLQGVALKLYIKTDNLQNYSVISFCKFYDLDIHGFRDGIFCNLEYQKGRNISYINANIFDNIFINKCLRPIRLINTADENDVVSGKSAIAFNIFRNIFIQHVVGDYPAIFMDGASYNEINSQVLDWIGNNVETNTKSRGNVISCLPGDVPKINNTIK